MFAWHEEENLQRSIKRIIGASLFWLVWGILTGFILALQRPLPWLFEQWSWWTSTRLQLYHSGLLLFGFAIPFLYACWMLRLRQISNEPLKWLTFWDWGFTLWQFALVWAVVGTFFGAHSSLPGWAWEPIIYALLMVASISTALGFSFNLPTSALVHQPLAVRLMLLGVWALPVALLCFLISPQLMQVLSPSMLQVTVLLALLFPLIGLMQPLSLSQRGALDHRRLDFFFWGALLCAPLANGTYSAAASGSFFFLLLQVIATLALLALLYTFVSWWRYPTLYAHHWLQPADALRTPTPAIPMGTYEADAAHANEPIEGADDEAHDWLPFFRWGGIFFAIAAAEGIIFALLRTIGHAPSPTWSMSHYHLHLIGAGVLWLQGSLCLMFAPAPENNARLRRLRKAAVAGVLLFTLGCWWEGLLHFYLEQNGLPRGTIYSVSGRWLRGFGGVFMFLSLWWMGQSLTWLMRNLDRLRKHDTPA